MSRRGGVVRAVVVALIALPLAAAAFASSLSLLLVRGDPALAVRLWPGNSLARAALADQLVAASPTDPPAEARRQATISLEQQPGNPAAARVMGVVTGMGGDAAGLERWLRFSEGRSRREIGTELALVEVAVTRGQVAGALVHYDRALRVFSPQPQLIDVLVGASEGAPVRTQLVAMLRRNPPWREGYLIHLVESGHATPDAVFATLQPLHLDRGSPADRRILSEAVGLLVGHDRSALARTLVGIPGTGVRNGGFEAANDYPPLDWKLSSGADLTGVIEQGPRPNGGNVLFLDASNDASGVVAEQTMALRPGRYTLSLVSGDGSATPETAPTIAILCPGRGAPLASVPLPTGAGVTRTIRVPGIAVPGDCPVQRITVSATAGDTGAPRPWVDDILLSPAR